MTSNKTTLLFVLLSLFLFIFSVKGESKLLVHVDDIENADEAAANIVNQYRADSSTTAVAVFNGAAPIIFAVPNNAYLQEYEAIYQAQGSSFNVLLCNNSLRGLNIPASAFPSWIKIVPAGIQALVEYQQSGFAYVKP